MNASSPIVANDLVRKFGDIEAVKGVDLEVQQGEIFGFLGPNGAGKSTTVRMLTTLLKPTSGSAKVAGFDVVANADDVRKRIGVALQDAAIDPLMTGSELLALQCVLYGLPSTRGKTRSAELLERVGLVAAKDRRVGTYSGGMRRRLDLALSLVHSPSVLFLDEPTTGLDPMSRMSLWEEVKRLNGEGTTVLLTTQYLEEADQLAGRIAIIDGGRIVREGVPKALKKAVGSPTVFVEVPPGQEAAAEGQLGVGLRGGAGAVADVVRALDEASIPLLQLQLSAPSLDDVFAEATGHRLEGAGSDAGAAGADDGTPSGKSGKPGKPSRGRGRGQAKSEEAQR
jgi:ABC-2 type transport system ATP-binding protein